MTRRGLTSGGARTEGWRKAPALWGGADAGRCSAPVFNKHKLESLT